MWNAHIAILGTITTQSVSVCGCVFSHSGLCNSRDCSPTGSSVHEILQARILEWVAISYSNTWY